MLSETAIAICVQWACQQEVQAPKPGNVNCFSEGHNMVMEQFILSAEAIAPIMASAEISVGERILQAVSATQAVVDCNTNLGIILLFAPLCHAIRLCEKFADLPQKLATTLSSLTVQDASACYQAIRLAQAGGLGYSDQQDISTPPTVTLIEAMKIAQHRDSIARQYGNNYQQIFDIGLASLTTRIKCGENVEWATAFAYLKLLSAIPDSLICRKQSTKQALAVTQKAQQFVFDMNKNNQLTAFKPQLIAWDNELKKKAINPGTTADMTAASLLLYAFQQSLSLTGFQYHDAFGKGH